MTFASSKNRNRLSSCWETFGLKHFQCNLAIQLGIESDIDLSHPSCRKEAEDPIPITNREGALGLLVTPVGERNPDMVNGCRDVIRIDRARVNPNFLFELDRNQAGDPGRSGFIQGTLPDQDVGQISARVLDPSLKSGDELRPIDEPR